MGCEEGEVGDGCEEGEVGDGCEVEGTVDSDSSIYS